MSTTRIRDKQVHVFMTEGEREKLKRRARKYGMGVGEFIRQALIHTDALKVTVIDLKPLNRANYELHKAGVNLNALLKRSTPSMPERTMKMRCVAPSKPSAKRSTEPWTPSSRSGRQRRGTR